MTDKFIVPLPGLWGDPWPQWFVNFEEHCSRIANENDWHKDTVMNRQLKPLGGRLIKTSTQGWYLRWDDESSHTMFVLKWS